VRSEFLRVKDLSKIPPSLRGWTLDVLSVIRRLGKQDFSLQEVYGFESELKAQHPRNENVRPKIRQQLQVLRDLGMIKFAGDGRYLLPS
jgi:type II restriction enzyme